MVTEPLPPGWPANEGLAVAPPAPRAPTTTVAVPDSAPEEYDLTACPPLPPVALGTSVPPAPPEAPPPVVLVSPPLAVPGVPGEEVYAVTVPPPPPCATTTPPNEDAPPTEPGRISSPIPPPPPPAPLTVTEIDPAF